MALLALLAPALALSGLLVTDRGQFFLAARASSLLERTLAGHFRIGRLAVHPGGLELTDVEVRDPDGSIQATADSIRVTPLPTFGVLFGISRGFIHLPKVEVRGPRVLVETTDSGEAKLARAFSPRTPAPVAQGPSNLQVEIDDLLVEEGSLAVLQEGSPPIVLLRRIELRSWGRLAGGGLTLRGGARGELLAPVRGAAALDFDGSLLLDTGVFTSRATLTPEGGGKLSVDGSLSLTGPRPSFHAEVGVEDVLLSSLDGRLPPLRTTGGATVQGDATSGRIDARLQSVELRSLHAGPLTARLDWDPSGIRIEKATLVVPAGSLEASGSLQRDSIHLTGSLGTNDARSLWAMAGEAAQAFGAEVPELDLSGSAQVRFALDGPLVSPRLRFEADAPSLSLGKLRASELRMTLDATGLPGIPRGQLHLTAARLEGAGPPLTGLRADLSLTKGRAEGRLSAGSALGPTEAVLGANLSPDALHFDHLDLAWPGARFSLTEPATVVLAGPDRGVSLALAGPEGSLTLKLRVQREGLTLDAAAHRLELSSLPPALVPPGAEGKLDLEAHLKGTVAHPSGTVHAIVDGGQVRGIDGLAATADVTLEPGRIRGTTEIARQSARLQARIDAAYPLDPSAPMTLEVQLQDLDLADLSRMLDLPHPLEGKLAGQAELSGDARHPKGRIDLHARSVTGLDTGPVDADAALDLAEADTHLLLKGTAGSITVDTDVTVSLEPGRLLEPGALQALRTAPAQGKVRARGLPLSRLPGLDLAGTAAVEAQLEGSAAGPRGQATILLSQVSRGGVDEADGLVHLTATAAYTTAECTLTRGASKLLAATIRVLAPPESIERGSPIEAKVDAPALPLSLLLSLAGSPRPAGGMVAAQLSASGSLGDPEVGLSVEGTGLSLGGEALGTIHAAGTEHGGAIDLTASLHDPAGGQAELSFNRDRDGSLRGSLTARALHLSLLGGAHADLRGLAGVVDADLTASGDPSDPTVRGKVRVREGILSWVNLGELRGIEGEIALEPGSIALRNAVVVSSGRLELAGDAHRVEKGWDFTLDAGARSFGVVWADLLRAYLSGNVRTTGHYAASRLEAKVEAGPLTVELPDTPSRDIQELDDHPDFVIHRGGTSPVLASAAPASAMQLIVDVSAPDVSLHSVDANLTASAQLAARSDPTRAGGLTLAGSRVTVKRGAVIVLGRRFEVERGALTYGPQDPPSDPHLDVQAGYDSPYAQVKVTVAGTMKKPVTTMRAIPAMTEAEIATLLATGRPQLTHAAGGVAEGSGAASVIGAVAADQLRKGISAKLPVDVIGVKSGESGAGAYSLEAGKYISDRVYVGYTHNFGVSGAVTSTQNAARVFNENELHLEYQLTPRFSLDGTYGDADKGGLDLFWKKDF